MPYSPSGLPANLTMESLAEYIQDELAAIAREQSETLTLELRPSHVEPAKRKEGMIAFADGTDWNPGGGAGAYQFLAGAWVKL